MYSHILVSCVPIAQEYSNHIDVFFFATILLLKFINQRQEAYHGGIYGGWRRDWILHSRGTAPDTMQRQDAALLGIERPDTVSQETTEEDWRKIASPWRYVDALFFYIGPPGHVLRSIRVPLSVSGVLILCNAIYFTVSVFIDSVPYFTSGYAATSIFSMASFIVSVLEGVKANKVYERWQTARLQFDTVNARLNQVVQMIHVHLYTYTGGAKKRPDRVLADVLTAWCMVLPYALIQELRGGVSLEDYCTSSMLDTGGNAKHPALLGHDECEMLLNDPKPQKYVMLKLRVLVNQMDLPCERYLVVEDTFHAIESSCTQLRSIHKSNFPTSFSLVITGFVMMWIIFLPFDVFASHDGFNNDTVTRATLTLWCWYVAMALFLFSLLLISLDEVINQLQNPFPSLPLRDAAIKAGIDMRRSVNSVLFESDRIYQ